MDAVLVGDTFIICDDFSFRLFSLVTFPLCFCWVLNKSGRYPMTVNGCGVFVSEVFPVGGRFIRVEGAATKADFELTKLLIQV